jgi:hypothetical protein
MADPKQIEQELREYLEREPNLRRDDRIVYLMNIINKHFEIDRIDHMVSYSDFSDMVSRAKASFATKPLPLRISNRQVDPSEVSHVLVIEALVGYLNKNRLLKRLVKFDYTR